MSNKFQTRLSEPQNLRKVFQNIQEEFTTNQASHSLEKKLSPFKRMLEVAKKSQSPFKFAEYIMQNQNSFQTLHENNKGNEKNEFVGKQENQEFLELYHNDPIFKCRIERLFNQEQKKSRKGSMKVPTRGSLDVNMFEDERLQLRTTFKNHCSQNERVLLTKIQGYKKLLKRQNSNDTSPSSEDNE